MGRYINLVGQKFGRLTVISFAGIGTHREALWNCRCECGGMIITSGTSLRTGNTQSCGCYRIERIRESNTTHGHTQERLFRIWCNIIQRCTNPTCKDYKYYGGDGVRVCDEWLNSYEAFRDWALANGYADDLTIERINNNKGYYPENCRWATRKEQANNTARNLILTIKGKTQALALHVDDPEINVHGLKYMTVLLRIRRQGWMPEEAFSIPLGGRRKKADRKV